MIDTKAFRDLSYGMYLISSVKDGRPVGCTVNTFAQLTSVPPQVGVAVNKDNFTAQAIVETGAYDAVVLSEEASMELIGTFGFHSSADVDKFADFATAQSAAGLPYVTDAACAHFSVRISQQIDLGSHIYFIGEVVESDRIEGASTPMTYAYYHQVKGGKTPPKASSYEPEEASAVPKEGATRIAWRCTICGHIEYVDELPDDFVCPLCGVGKELFEKIEVPA